MDELRMQIGEVAERAGLSVRTVRFYEESGLVTPCERSQGGFRLYTHGDLDRLRLIRRLKPLNFSLEEMRHVLLLLDELTDRMRPGTEQDLPRGLLERLAGYRDLADQRVATLHAEWSRAAAFATHLRQQIEQVQFLREARR